ncbi:MAG: peptidylprolyl isomerase [Gemmatimonadota bacterium]
MKGYLFIAVLTAAVVGCDAITAHTDVVARVGRHELTVDGTVEMLAGSPQVPARPEVIGSVAELWVDYTILARMAASDSTLAELDLGPMVEPYVEQQTFTQLREQVMTTDTVIGGDELRQAFAEQAPGLRVRARHILLTYPEGADDEARDSVQAVAEELRERAAAGEEFEELAAEYSQDQGTAQAGGDLGWFGRGRMVQPFEDAAFALESGEVSEVVETPFGLHLIKVEERETPAWDEERGEQFRQQLVSERRQGSLTEYVESLRGPAELEVESGAAEIARGLAGDPSGRLSGRAASRELVSWTGGEFTTREFVGMLRRFPPQQQAQYAQLSDEQMENVLREMATNELVMADARERGIEVPQAEQDSIKRLMADELQRVVQASNLGGPPREGETEAEAVERRVRSLMEGILSGQRNLIPLGPLSFAMREQVDWEINESSFAAVVNELQERRAATPAPQPMPPAGEAGQQPPAPAPDTGG